MATKKTETKKYKVLLHGVRIIGHVPHKRGDKVELTAKQAKYPFMAGQIGDENAELPAEAEAVAGAEIAKKGKK